MSESHSKVDAHLRLRLVDLSPELFERFFLHFFNSGISLAIERGGQKVERRIIEANTYATGSGRNQEGVDIVAKVEGGETWAFQCKRCKKWSPSDTQNAIKKAAGFSAQHYFLLVACDPHENVQKEIAKHPQWSFWNLDRICAEFRERVPTAKQPQALFFLSPDELKRFAPYATDTFLPPEQYFKNSTSGSFHHGLAMVGRTNELEQMLSFASPNGGKVLVISATGGEGKSRLLWELVQKMAIAQPDTEVLVLNPHAFDSISLSLWDKAKARIVIVDDAHRLERVSHELLTCVQQGVATKLILATRPQGKDALNERLMEHGLLLQKQELNLTRLKAADFRELAKNALGTALQGNIDALIGLTGKSPFLTVLAGYLLQTGKLTWGNWSSADEFRAQVFRSFEKENLAHLSDADKKHCERLLRLVAFVSPITPGPGFNDKVATCLGISKIDAETYLQRLQAAGIIAGEQRNLRVIPDLFSDFLVYDAAFDKERKLPVFARTVLENFSEMSAALLRNLAEASWVASTRTIEHAEFLRPLLEAEFERFDNSNFFERGQILEHWATFSVYLPAESLRLAKKAIEQTSAPSGDSYSRLFGVNEHRYLLEHVSVLLKPIAKWQDDSFRHQALDILWELGERMPKTILRANQNHPWEVIADVLHYEPYKPLFVTESVLDWLEKLISREDVLSVFASKSWALSTLLKPCFNRSMEYTWWEGRTVHWCSQALSPLQTEHYRQRALKIIRSLLCRGNWLVAHNVIDVLSYALSRIGKAQTNRLSEDESDRFLASWRPERLKALPVLQEILTLHPHTVVRFAARRLLMSDLAYEEDPEFAKAAKDVLIAIPTDLNLWLMASIYEQGHYEFLDEIGLPQGAGAFDKIRELWDQKVCSIAQDLVVHYPIPEQAIACLSRVIEDASIAGYSPNFFLLLTSLTKINHFYAANLARILLKQGVDVRLAAAWYYVLFGIPISSKDKADELLQLALNHPSPDVRAGIIQYISTRSRSAPGMEAGDKALIELIATKPSKLELQCLIRFVEWLPVQDSAWGFQLLEKLPLNEIASETTKISTEVYGELLQALFPYQERATKPPLSTVIKVLSAMVHVQEIEIDHYGNQFDQLAKLYPRAVYDFILARLAYAESEKAGDDYRPLPSTILRNFRLPELAKEQDFSGICLFLWAKVLHAKESRMHYYWVALFQNIVLEASTQWVPQLKQAIINADTVSAIDDLVELISFHGSLIVIRFPEIASALLQRAQAIGQTKEFERMRAKLYGASGPKARNYTNGVLDPNMDYLEAEAAKAAEQYAADPILGPFYQWIRDRERQSREENRRMYEVEMAAIDG